MLLASPAVDAQGWVATRGIVSRRFRYFYVPVPKVASSTLLEMFYAVEGLPIPERLPGIPDRHSRGPGSLPRLASLREDEQHTVLSDPSYLRFAVVRNPFTRVVAAWFNKIWLQSGDQLHIQQEISQWVGRSPNDPPTFGEFVSWIVDTQAPHACDEHWRPMVHLLGHDQVNYNLIGRIEQLPSSLAPLAPRLGVSGNDFAAMLHRSSGNQSIPFDRRHLYNESTALQVSTFYAADFDRYGYDRESWRALVGAAPPSAADLEAAAVRALRNRGAQAAMLNRSLSEAWRRVFSAAPNEG